jgi:hypothetical protein
MDRVPARASLQALESRRFFGPRQARRGSGFRAIACRLGSSTGTSAGRSQPDPVIDPLAAHVARLRDLDAGQRSMQVFAELLGDSGLRNVGGRGRDEAANGAEEKVQTIPERRHADNDGQRDEDYQKGILSCGGAALVAEKRLDQGAKALGQGAHRGKSSIKKRGIGDWRPLSHAFHRSVHLSTGHVKKIFLARIRRAGRDIWRGMQALNKG